MSTAPVQLYVLDPAFTNRNIPSAPFFHNAGGIAKLSSRGLSYFSTPCAITDPRITTTRSVAWAPETRAICLVDQSVYGEFVTALTMASASVTAALFGIIDILAFNYSPGILAATLETTITENSELSPYYQANTLTIGGATNLGTIYSSDLTTTSITCPTKVGFVLNVPSGSSTLSYAITVWLDNTTFLNNYTNSTITDVIPPINYSDLLSLPFSTTTGTMTSVAATAAFTQPLINTAIMATEPSGYAAYVAKVYDGTTIINVTFGITYVGQIPTFSAMRAAILAAVEASGVGTTAQWQIRIPELFIQSRIYLIPLWDQTVSSGGGTVYTGIASPNQMLAKASSVLGAEPVGSLVSQYGQILTAAYDLLPIVAVPDSITQPIDSLQTLYPTYQAYAPTNPAFLYMATATQNFATLLNTALPVAAGLATNTAFPVIIDGPMSYISFTQQFTEFCILTKSFYLSQV